MHKSIIEHCDLFIDSPQLMHTKYIVKVRNRVRPSLEVGIWVRVRVRIWVKGRLKVRIIIEYGNLLVDSP
jgi:hypothetical protein